MALPNGHALHLLVAFQDRLLGYNPMEACFALPIVLSNHKNADQSAMARIVFCMPLASAIVEAVPCVPDVKKALPPSNHDGSVQYSGRSLTLQLLAHLLGLTRLTPLLFPRWCGEIGPAVASGGSG